MGLNKIRLGDYIERSTANNSNLKYGEDLIAGVNNTGLFITPKGSTAGVNLKPYKIVQNGAFVYNPTRLDLGSIAYRTEGLCIVSHLYMIFYLTEEGKEIINPQWLFMYFRRTEFQREVTFRNFGSQRPEFNYEDMSNIIIPLPPIDIQQKYVDVYQAILANQQSYERGLEDLKLTCDAYIDQLRNKYKSQKLGAFISMCEEKNEGLQYGIDDVKGISIEKKFIDTKANMEGVSLRPYAVIKPDEFAYVTVTSRNGGKISLAHNNTQNTYICSSSYVVFSITDTDTLLPSYFAMLFRRSEFDRYARFHSWGSARETFDWEEMCDVEIPVPPIEIQQDIVNIYEVYLARKEITEKLKNQIKEICPILIKGSIEESSR
jgi:type I restriction enzyme S subunit